MRGKAHALLNVEVLHGVHYRDIATPQKSTGKEITGPTGKERGKAKEAEGEQEAKKLV